MRKTLTAVLLSTSLLTPTLAFAQPTSGKGIFGWLAPKQTRVAAAPSAAEILAGVQKFYAGIGGVKAKFRQEVTNATFGRTDISDGQLLIKKPGKMRWEYYSKKRKGTTKVAKDFISNGNMLFVVDYENKQVIQKDLQKNLLPTAVTFLYGKGDLSAEFTPEADTSGTYGGKGDLVIKLSPKSTSAQYKSLHLVVDAGTYRVKESILVDSAGNKNHFRFYEPDFAAKLDDKIFEFSAKSPAVKSFRVIDGDKVDDTAVDKTP
jgi:outer membrane lipoprotein carrier protein